MVISTILFTLTILIFVGATLYSFINFEKTRFRPIVKSIKYVMLSATISVLSLGAYTVESGTVGVVSTLGKYSEDEKSAGFHIKIPTIQSVQIVDVRQEVSQEIVSTLDVNNLPIVLHVSIKTRILDNSASEMLVKYGYNMYESLIKPSIRETVRNLVGQYSGEDIAKSREKLSVELQAAMEEVFNNYPNKYFEFLGLDIRDIKLDAVVMDKIRAVQLAKQREKELENEVLQKKQEAQKRQIDADTAYYERVKEAEAKAMAIETEANAISEANQKIAQSVTPNLIKYNQIEKWNGDIPRVTGSNGLNLFIPEGFAK